MGEWVSNIERKKKTVFQFLLLLLGLDVSLVLQLWSHLHLVLRRILVIWESLASVYLIFKIGSTRTRFSSCAF